MLALTPAFYRSRQGRSFPVANEEALVRLRPGTNVGDFARRPAGLARRYPATQGVQVTNLADQQAKVGQAIQPQADALALFAALASRRPGRHRPAAAQPPSWSPALRTIPS